MENLDVQSRLYLANVLCVASILNKVKCIMQLYCLLRAVIMNYDIEQEFTV
jgi:hypothetical protein